MLTLIAGLLAILIILQLLKEERCEEREERKRWRQQRIAAEIAHEEWLESLEGIYCDGKYI